MKLKVITSALMVVMFLMSSSIIVMAAAREQPYEEVVMVDHQDKAANPLDLELENNPGNPISSSNHGSICNAKGCP